MATREDGGNRGPAERDTGLRSVHFFQLDIDFDDDRIRSSDWGSVRLVFVGHARVLYLNLNIGGRWIVRNLPVLSREGIGVRQDAWTSFPLGNAVGTRVRSAVYGCALTPRPLGLAPPTEKRATIERRHYRLRRGMGGPSTPTGIRAKDPTPVEGDEAGGPKAIHTKFPNQPCGPNECVVAAISNSLKFLNRENSLGIPDGDISIDKLKKPTGWTRKEGCPEGWQDGKRDYVEGENKKTGKKKWPVDTSVPNKPPDYAREIYEAIRRGCDVEIVANHHCVAATGAQRLKNGKYSFDLTHDPKQQKKEGEGITETVTYNPKTNTVLDGSPWIAGEKILLVVIECPVKVP